MSEPKSALEIHICWCSPGSNIRKRVRRNGGLTTEMKKIKNGEDLWKIVDPCPEEF